MSNEHFQNSVFALQNAAQKLLTSVQRQSSEMVVLGQLLQELASILRGMIGEINTTIQNHKILVDIATRLYYRQGDEEELWANVAVMCNIQDGRPGATPNFEGKWKSPETAE